MDADRLEWTIYKTSSTESWLFILMSEIGECQTSAKLGR